METKVIHSVGLGLNLVAVRCCLGRDCRYQFKHIGLRGNLAVVAEGHLHHLGITLVARLRSHLHAIRLPCLVVHRRRENPVVGIMFPIGVVEAHHVWPIDSVPHPRVTVAIGIDYLVAIPHLHHIGEVGSVRRIERVASVKCRRSGPTAFHALIVGGDVIRMVGKLACHRYRIGGCAKQVGHMCIECIGDAIFDSFGLHRIAMLPLVGRIPRQHHLPVNFLNCHILGRSGHIIAYINSKFAYQPLDAVAVDDITRECVFAIAKRVQIGNHCLARLATSKPEQFFVAVIHHHGKFSSQFSSAICHRWQLYGKRASK